MSDLETGVDAPDDDLRSQLSSMLSGETPVEKSTEVDPPELAALDAPAQSEADRARDEAGRFAKKQEAKAEEPTAPDAKPVEAVAPEAETTEQAAPHRPPPGWSPASKAAFANLPPEVQADVVKREGEVNQGLAKLAEYKGLEPLAELSRQNGTTLVNAVNQYRQFEVSLQQDFIGGIGLVCQRYGVQPAALANAILARSGGSAHQSAGTGAAPHGNQQPSGVDLSPITRELESLKAFVSQTQQREAQQQQRIVESQIEAFKSDPKNLYFENVRPQMAKIMQAGLASTLQEAYDAACWQTPDVRSLLINQQAGTGQAQAAKQAAAATQARQASKSITGSPSAGVANGSAPASSLRAELEQNFAAAGSRA